MDTLKKLLNATKEAALPDVPGTFGKLSKLLLLTSVGIFTASPGWAVVVAPTSITVRVPSGTTNGQTPGIITYTGPGGASGPTAALNSTPAQTAATSFVDDAILNSITFGSTTISNLTPGLRNTRGAGALVTLDRNQISATYGDNDTASDNNPNPFVTSGSGTTAYADPSVAANTNARRPEVQDTAIQAAFSSLSLSQGIGSPGNGGTAGRNDYTFRLLFENGIVDNDLLTDQIPELIIFERGGSTSTQQSEYSVRAITGGSLAGATYAGPAVNVLRGVQTPSGIFIDTLDPAAVDQEPLNFAGLDLTELGLTTASQVLYGVEITSINGSGADIFGLALTAASPTQLRAQALPEPLTIIGSGVALGFGLLMKREHARKRQKTEQS